MDSYDFTNKEKRLLNLISNEAIQIGNLGKFSISRTGVSCWG